MWKILIWAISAEWVLNRRDNGGAAIALRSLICSAILFLFIIGVVNAVDPEKSWHFSLHALQLEIKGKITWFGALFAAIYAALYSRFASQWTYLANLYNSIKAASIMEGIEDARLAEWKAGFIEDADYLHLSHKENFASIIMTWGEEEAVKESFIKFTPGGLRRYQTLMESISVRYEEICKKHETS
jgi:hypothetical protein